MTDNETAEVCEHHDEPLFTMGRHGVIDGKLHESEYVFCRHCAGSVSKITCPECENVMPVMNLEDSTIVMAQRTLRNLSCTRCKSLIASADVTGIGP